MPLLTVPEPLGVVHEGAPAEVSCRYFVPEVLPARSAHDVQPLEYVAQYTKSPTSEAVGNKPMRALAAEVAPVPPFAMASCVPDQLELLIVLALASEPNALPLAFDMMTY